MSSCANCGGRLPHPPGAFCQHCGAPSSPATAARKRRDPVRVAALIAVIVLAIVSIGYCSSSGGGGSDGTSVPSAEYTQALQQCENGPGALWVAQHPGLDPQRDPNAVTQFAAVINRCLVDTMHVDPKYLPNKPIAPAGQPLPPPATLTPVTATPTARSANYDAMNRCIALITQNYDQYLAECKWLYEPKP